jgi:hypothetical protein
MFPDRQGSSSLPWRRVQYLNTRFPNQWAGEAYPMSRPLRSPDLTPLEFSLCGFVKVDVYFPLVPANINDLWGRISDPAADVMPRKLRRAWEGIHCRWDILCYIWKSL